MIDLFSPTEGTAGVGLGLSKQINFQALYASPLNRGRLTTSLGCQRLLAVKKQVRSNKESSQRKHDPVNSIACSIPLYFSPRGSLSTRYIFSDFSSSAGSQASTLTHRVEARGECSAFKCTASPNAAGGALGHQRPNQPPTSQHQV